MLRKKYKLPGSKQRSEERYDDNLLKDLSTAKLLSKLKVTEEPLDKIYGFSLGKTLKPKSKRSYSKHSSGSKQSSESSKMKAILAPQNFSIPTLSQLKPSKLRTPADDEYGRHAMMAKKIAGPANEQANNIQKLQS